MKNLLTWVRANARSLLALGLPLTLYLLTLAPTIYNLDSAELTTAAATGGLTRATGYPLYLLLGFAWTHLPLGDVGYRMNLFSAVNGALTIMLADRILQRWQVGPWAAFAALGLLATAPYFWALSLIAEVYTLQTTLMAACLWLMVRWNDQPTPGRSALLGFAVGLSLAHHGATVLFVPGCLWYVATAGLRRALAPRVCLPALAGLAAGLSVYLYLPLRYAASPAFNYAGHYTSSGVFEPVNLQTLAGLWWLVSGQSFHTAMLAYPWPEIGPQIAEWALQLARAFYAVGIGPGLLGLGVLWRRDWRTASTLTVMLLGHAAFYIDYRVADKDTMFLPNFLIWALWAGLGCQWLLAWVEAAGDKPRLRWPVWLLRGVMVLGVLGTTLWTWPLVDLSRDWSARARGEAILQEVEPHALVLGYWDTVPIVEYLQLVEGQRPDVQAINRFLIGPDDMTSLILREVARRPVYIDSLPADLAKTLEPIPLKVDKLYKLQTKNKDAIFAYVKQQ